MLFILLVNVMFGMRVSCSSGSGSGSSSNSSVWRLEVGGWRVGEMKRVWTENDNQDAAACWTWEGEGFC